MSDRTLTRDEHGIAVIGMAGRFPGAADVREFWTNLRVGKESIRFFTIEELIEAGIDRAVCEDPRYVGAKAMLDGAENFDAAFFGYTPREAALIDPQQRLFLESAWTALEHAGYEPSSCNTPVGVFAGQSINTYCLAPGYRAATGSMGALDVLIGSDKDFLATRVSYKLNLKGPSLTIQTACSTSLVAVCEACKSLALYECDMALAGGVSVRVPRVAGYLYQQGSIASADGSCRPFDADSNGTVGGEGVGVVVLKRLADALADGDTIHAVVRGWAINNDGSLKVGYTAPSVDGQAEVIATAQSLGGIEPNEISYIEAHGTGTALGDPIEVAGLTQVFGPRRGDRPTCAIGSVKSNVGHLDAAAGIAGFIKTVMALEHRELPPTLHFKRVNPKIDLDRTPFYVNSELRPWTECALPRRAGVSSFGIGGTNAHVVLEEAPTAGPASASRSHKLLLLSARSGEALDTAAHELAQALSSGAECDLADAAYTLALGRRSFSHRRAVVCRNLEQAVASLRTDDAGALASVRTETKDRSVAFLFPGQGSQYLHMGAELYRTEPVFRREIERCARLLEPELGADLREILYPTRELEPASERLRQTLWAQPSLFAVAFALAQLWKSWGVRAEAMIGHSIGEYVAACLAGVFALEDAVKLVATRARLMQSLPPGAMLSIALERERVAEMLDGRVDIAAVNEPFSCVASGAEDAIAELEARLARQGVACRRLHTSHAFHSRMMAPILDAFGEVLSRVPLEAPQIPWISNVSGTWIRTDQATDPSYWVEHLRGTVRFADGIGVLLGEGERLLLEVGPGNTLSGLAARHPARRDEHALVASMRHPHDRQSDVAVVLGAAAKLWLSGVNLDWRGFYANERRRRVPLPTYPFERRRHWIADAPRQAAAQPLQPQAAARLPVSEWFSVPSWRRAPSAAFESESHNREASDAWLVFADRHGVGEALVAELRAQGALVFVVTAGDAFSAAEDGSFALDFACAQHYEALLESLLSRSGIPGRIVHLLGVTGAAALSPQALLERCFYSPMFLAQAVGRRDLGASSTLLFVSDGACAVTGDEPICPEKATLIGPSRVIPCEYPNIRCRLVDLAATAAGSPASAWLAARLIHEATSDDDAAVIAYRGRHRWLPAFERVDLPPAAAASRALRDRGVYLITGGLGGVGLALAHGIATEVRARLVLLGRSALPPREQWSELLASDAADAAVRKRVAAVQALEALGAEVMMAAADVTDAHSMMRVLEAVRERFGRIDGVIHAAGTPGGGVIQLKTREDADRVMAPKLQGTRVLLELLADDEPDFIVLCSSLAAITAIPGQIDYTAANAFQDAVAQHCAQTSTAVISVNWDTWRDAGMAVDALMPNAWEEARKARLAAGIGAAEGADAFLRILESGYAQVLVSTRPVAAAAAVAGSAMAEAVDSEREVQPVAAAAPAAAAASHARPSLDTRYVAPADELESAIAVIWEELFGISGIGMRDDFFELGGHSLLAIQVLARVNAAFGVELLVNDLFSDPTIEALARRVRGARPAGAERAAGLDDFAAVIDQLSDDDVQRLLDEHRGVAL